MTGCPHITASRSARGYPSQRLSRIHPRHRSRYGIIATPRGSGSQETRPSSTSASRPGGAGCARGTSSSTAGRGRTSRWACSHRTIRSMPFRLGSICETKATGPVGSVPSGASRRTISADSAESGAGSGSRNVRSVRRYDVSTSYSLWQAMETVSAGQTRRSAATAARLVPLRVAEFFPYHDCSAKSSVRTVSALSTTGMPRRRQRAAKRTWCDLKPKCSSTTSTVSTRESREPMSVRTSAPSTRSGR